MYNLMCKYEMEMSLKICDYNLITVQNVLEAVSMLKGVKSSLFIIPPPHTHNFSTTGLTCINRFNYKLKMSNFMFFELSGFNMDADIQTDPSGTFIND